VFYIDLTRTFKLAPFLRIAKTPSYRAMCRFPPFAASTVCDRIYQTLQTDRQTGGHHAHIYARNAYTRGTKNHAWTFELHFLYRANLQPWLGPPLTTMFFFCFYVLSFLVPPLAPLRVATQVPVVTFLSVRDKITKKIVRGPMTTHPPPYLQAGLTDLDEIWHDWRSYGVASPKKCRWTFPPFSWSTIFLLC